MFLSRLIIIGRLSVSFDSPYYPSLKVVRQRHASQSRAGTLTSAVKNKIMVHRKRCWWISKHVRLLTHARCTE